MEDLSQLMEHKNQIVRICKESSTLLENLMTLSKGTIMEKYAYRNGKKHFREFSITPDLKCFQWKKPGSSRNIRKYQISDILEVSSGNSEFSCKTHTDIKQDQENLCFTVLLKERPVSIVASSFDIRNIWVTGLKFLLKTEKADLLIEIQTYDALFNEKFKKITQELINSEKDGLKSNDSMMIEDPQTHKLKKRIKELEKNNARLQHELFEINSKADKDSLAGDELKKEIINKEQSEKKLERQLELLNLQFENMEREFNQKVLENEEKLSGKDKKIIELQTEYDEFKRQIKESFNKTLVQKVQQYRDSKEVLCSYVNYLKERLEIMEKEVALWQAVVHSHILPIYQSKKPGKMPGFKQVMEFALDTMERKFLTDRSQTHFLSLLTEARKNVRP